MTNKIKLEIQDIKSFLKKYFLQTKEISKDFLNSSLVNNFSLEINGTEFYNKDFRLQLLSTYDLREIMNVLILNIYIEDKDKINFLEKLHNYVSSNNMSIEFNANPYFKDLDSYMLFKNKQFEMFKFSNKNFNELEYQKNIKLQFSSIIQSLFKITELDRNHKIIPNEDIKTLVLKYFEMLKVYNSELFTYYNENHEIPTDIYKIIKFDEKELKEIVETTELFYNLTKEKPIVKGFHKKIRTPLYLNNELNSNLLNYTFESEELLNSVYLDDKKLMKKIIKNLNIEKAHFHSANIYSSILEPFRTHHKIVSFLSNNVFLFKNNKIYNVMNKILDPVYSNIGNNLEETLKKEIQWLYEREDNLDISFFKTNVYEFQKNIYKEDNFQTKEVIVQFSKFLRAMISNQHLLYKLYNEDKELLQNIFEDITYIMENINSPVLKNVGMYLVEKNVEFSIDYDYKDLEIFPLEFKKELISSLVKVVNSNGTAIKSEDTRNIYLKTLTMNLIINTPEIDIQDLDLTYVDMNRVKIGRIINSKFDIHFEENKNELDFKGTDLLLINNIVNSKNKINFNF